MKKIIVSMAVVMMLALVIATIYYERATDGFEALNQKEKAEKQALKESQQRIAEQEKQLQPIHPNENNNRIGYSLQNNQLQITYDGGEIWKTVPIEKKNLFAGEYNGNQQELIPQSFILTDGLAAFLYGSGEPGANQHVMFTFSTDKGKTWHDSVVTEKFPGVRFRKVAFVNDRFGYVILSGGRTMSQEYSTVYITHNSGKDWEHVNNPDTTRLLSDGGFVDEQTGFLSYGTINPEEPDLYVSEDGGNTWQQSEVKIPKQYDKIFVTAEVPAKKGKYLVMDVGQGPNGDYLGGNVRGRFTSKDNGKTWQFEKEVQPDEK